MHMRRKADLEKIAGRRGRKKRGTKDKKMFPLERGEMRK